MRELGLNERQIKALNYLQEKRMLTRKNYEKIFSVSKVTAFRDIEELIEKEFIKVAGKGPAAKYYLK